jgi:hypothetical protein
MNNSETVSFQENSRTGLGPFSVTVAFLVPGNM